MEKATATLTVATRVLEEESKGVLPLLRNTDDFANESDEIA